jgi:hypothetical protein
MKTLKFKDKVKKKCKEFLAVTLISSSLLLTNTGCDNKEEDIYGDSPIVDIEQNDKDTNSNIVNDKDTIINDKDNVSDDKEIEDKEENDEDLENDLSLDSDDETEDVDDTNCVFEEPDEEILSNENTGTKYIVSSEAIKKEYEKDCFNYIKLAKLLAEHCGSLDEIDISTPSGKCYVPYYLTGNKPHQATSSCVSKLFLETAEGSIKEGIHKTDPDLFYGRLKALNRRLIYSYIIHEKINSEDIRNVVTYPYDNIDEKYLIPNFNNSFEFNGVPYKMLNEHLDVLHEMEFINELNNKHTRYKFSMLWFYPLVNSVFFTLDLMKCPIEEGKEASIAVLAFSTDPYIVENDPKYQKFEKGECDEYFDKITEEYIREVECNN